MKKNLLYVLMSLVMLCTVVCFSTTAIATNATSASQAQLTVTKQLKSASAYKGKKVKLTVKAKGEELKYTWYYKDKGAKSFKKTNTFKGNTYTLEMSSKNSGRKVYCKITDKYGNSVKTKTATLTMRTTLKITAQPKSSSAYNGKSVKLTVKVKGDGLKYTWYYKDKGAKSFKKTNTFKGNTYTLEMSSKNSGRQVYCLITDKYGKSVKTKAATLTMRTALKVTAQPSSTSAYSGKKASVSFKATGDGLKYTWYYKDKSASSFKKTDTFKGTSYSLEMSSKRNGRQVYCKITDKYGTSIQTDVVTFYVKKAAAEKTCTECKLKNDGTTFNNDCVHTISNKIKGMPLTYQAVFTLTKKDMEDDSLRTLDRFHNDKASTAYTETPIISNDDTWESSICVSVTNKGNPALNLREKDMYIKFRIILFDKVNVLSDKPVHLAITVDHSAKKAHCYVNGKLMQTKSLPSSVKKTFTPVCNYAIGGDLYNGNPNYFRGKLYSAGLWSDIRTAAEIEADYLAGINTSDSRMLAYYDLTSCADCMKKDLSPSKNNLNTDKLWLTKDEVEPVGDYDYSFAVIGDTQELSEASTKDKASESLTKLYQWLVDNKEEHKIEYVIGLGDITQKSFDYEWKHAKDQIYKLNGVIPYLLTRGNHDYNLYEDKNDPTKVTAGFNLTFNDGEYDKNQLTGVMREGDLSNAYRVINICGIDYLMITLDFGPEKDVLEWASDIIEQYPTHRVIIATHGYMYRDGTTLDAGDAYPASKWPIRDKKAQQATKPSLDGDDMWEMFVSKHENIQLVLSGHDPAQHVVYRQDKGEKGNVVTQMLIDPQHIDDLYELTGMVAMFYFSDNGNTLTVRYYSTLLDKYGTERSNFTIDLTEMD